MMRNIKALHYFSFFNSFRPHWPIAVIYFQGITSSYASAMLIYSVVFLSQALLEVPAGMYSDGIGRRRTMILGAICASMYITCYAVGGSFSILVIGACLEGLARALFSGTDSALLFESLPKNDRAAQFQHFLGRISSMSQLALCLSALLCSLLALHSLKLVVWVSVVPQVLSLLSTVCLLEVESEEVHQQSILQIVRMSFQQFQKNARLRLLALADTLEFGFGEAVFYFQSAFFNTLIPTWALGLARCLNHFAGFVGFWFSGKFVSRFGARKTLIAGTAVATFIKLYTMLFASVFSPFIMGASNIIFGPCTTARSTLLQLELATSSGRR